MMKRASTDPIADLLTRIRNALAVNKPSVEVPHSKVKEEIVKLMQKQNLVEAYAVSKDFPRVIEIRLRSKSTNSPINVLQRVSKPGRKVYSGAKEIPSVMRGKGLLVVSTSKGIMSGKEAKEQGLGGELMCKVW